MKRDVIISIKGLQQMDDPETDEITLTTEGRFYRRSGSYYLTYEESEVTGFEHTRTMVKISRDGVSVTRAGKYPSMIMFEPQKRHMCMYSTAYGDIMVGVSTRCIENGLTDDGGRLSVSYDIEVQHAYLSTNSLTIDVRPAPVQ